MRFQIFFAITHVKDEYLSAYNSNQLIAAICEGIVYTFSPDSQTESEFPSSPYWNQIVAIGLKRPDDKLHSSIQQVFHKFSSFGLGLHHVPYVLFLSALQWREGAFPDSLFLLPGLITESSRKSLGVVRALLNRLQLVGWGGLSLESILQIHHFMKLCLC